MSSDTSSQPLVFVVTSTQAAADAAARVWSDRWRAQHPHGRVVTAPDPAAWPFLFPLVPDLGDGPIVVYAPDVHEAFVNHQTGSTRLVTTQAIFLCETWRQALRAHGHATLLATADPDALREHAPEVLARTSLFGNSTSFVEAGSEAPLAPDAHSAPLAPQAPTPLAPLAPLALLAPLREAFRSSYPAERLRLCLAALELGRTAPALVATASVCMEVNDLDAAARDLDEALALAPEWAAAHFERGKLWLRVDDMTQAGDAFRAATRALPGFGAAWANLGATLGELDRQQEALAAFEHALEADPASHQALNNIGVVTRELGRLAESERAFRQVVQLVPDLAFGYYNLGHTLFLQGRYRAALSAYAEGQARDPEKNPVQATRLALCKLATGDATGALRDLQDATATLPREYRRQLLGDTSAVLWALVTHAPDLSGWQPVHAWMSGELERLA